MNFDDLVNEARKVLHPRKLSAFSEAGGVAAAILTDAGKVYTGVCIDTACSVGFCAEHAAAAAMVTAGENRVTKMVAVNWNGAILPPCGRCREFINELHDDNGKAEVLVNTDVVVLLAELIPHDWRHAPLDEFGVYYFPMQLPNALAPRRTEFETFLTLAQRRLVAFANAHGWERHVEASFIDRVEIFDRKEDFDRRCLSVFDVPPDTQLPKTYCAALENRVLIAVTPELFREVYPEGDEPDAFAKLLCHEMAHRLHIRVLNGNEQAMGDVWFFEGFALTAADQFAATAPTLSEYEIWQVIAATERGSYRNYVTAMRHCVARAALPELVARAGDPGFVEWLRGLPVPVSADGGREAERKDH